MKLTLVYHGNPTHHPPFYVLLHRRSDASPVGGTGNSQDVREWLESDKVKPLDDNFDFTEISDLVLTARDVRSCDKVVFMDENDPTEQTPDILTSSSGSTHPFDSILQILGRVKGGNLKVRVNGRGGIMKISNLNAKSLLPTSYPPPSPSRNLRSPGYQHFTAAQSCPPTYCPKSLPWSDLASWI